MPELTEIREALKEFAGSPEKVAPLASVLGFTPTPLPRDLLADGASALSQAFESRTGRVADRFGVAELYRVADGPVASSALYLAVLSDWGARSSARDRARRRVAKAVVQNTGDTRSLILLVPNDLERGARGEVEVVMPRLRERAGNGDISTVRALVSTAEPSRFHVDLVQALAAQPGDSLTALTARWRKAFSVERVTREFYQAYAGVRDRIVAALVAANPDHPWVLSTATSEDGEARRHEWATRQLGRVLFLWFLQSKRWLGYDGSGEGSPTYLLDLWNRRGEARGTFWSGMLRPLFFDAMAAARPSTEVTALLGAVPFLNGGLFRNSALEDEVEEAGGPLELPDEVFNPGAADGQPHTALSLLARYRFTTRESTPDDQSVDPDPELLGRVFENLYQADERHDSGTYYTPREIVHFMCRQALDGYLRDAAGVDQETLDWLRREVTDPEDSDRALDADLRERIDEALERVRICDPAVGSGAFLLGTMQEMVRLRRGMAHAAGEFDPQIEERVEEWKRRAIEHSLYGVDINPEAVEICQLRLWLSLVLDYQGHPREVRPLPNLDFRIMVGDSLVDRFKEIAFVESLPSGAYQAPFEIVSRLNEEHEKVERWQTEYEHAAPHRQRELREQIRNAKLRVMRAQIEAQREIATQEASATAAKSVGGKGKQKSATARVEAYDQALVELAGTQERQRVEKPFLWPLAFADVFQDGGFHVVLANPPYVRQEKLSAEDQNVYKQAYKEVYAGTADILVFFYARALQLLRDGGRLAFITSNKYMRAGYGAGLREYLPSSLAIERVIDFGDLPLFESNGKVVAAYPAVLTAVKRRGPKDSLARVVDLTHVIRNGLADERKPANPEHVREAVEDLDALLLATEIPDYPQALLRPQGWMLEEPALVRLFDRLTSTGTPLGQYVDGRIYYGIKTGLNEAFVIDQPKRDELIAADSRSVDIIKPWLRGKDIKRWAPRWDHKYVILSVRGTEIDAYPAVKEHLASWREDLKPKSSTRDKRGRAPGEYAWYELQASPGKPSEFLEPKVIFTHFLNSPSFAYDDAGFFHNNACTFAVVPTSAVCAVVNSRVAWAFLAGVTTRLQNNYRQLFVQFIERIPIPTMSLELISQLEELTAQLQRDPDNERLEDEANRLVNAAFGLTDDEQAAINRWWTREFSRVSAAPHDEGESESDEPEEPD